MSFEPIDLPWLVPAPEGFRNRCRALSSTEPHLGQSVQTLASHRLDAQQAAALGKALVRLRSEGATLDPLTPFRLDVLASATFDFIVSALPAAAARHGVLLETRLAALGQVEQEAFDPASELRRRSPDGVLLGVDHRWLGLDAPCLHGDHEGVVEAALQQLKDVASAILQDVQATPILPTIATPPGALFGNFDRRLAGSVRGMIERFNASLPELCVDVGAVLLDVAALAEQVGTFRWFNPTTYNLYKLPFAADATPLYCEAVGRLIGAMRGKSRKCLVLDLDNTCWGGVIGDDGLEGIRIGGGVAEGEAFAAIQRTALELKARGVLLAVSSKNDDHIARAPFREHPDMVLRESDIAVFQANWQDKASNLEAIARTLDIGLDALVLLDDNGAERAQVRAALPMVACPELPLDPAYYPAHLLAAGYFETVSFSEEDRLRSESYAANAQRAEVLSRSRNLEDYLASLDMKIGFAQFDVLGRARITQLINKTNQFNLTTKRYTAAQVEELEKISAFTLQVRLSDRYGDFGMIGVVIARAYEKEAAAWEVDSWLMSCRVLGRKVEEAMLAELVAAAKAVGVTTLYAQYVPTAKNGMVASHYDKLGFSRLDTDADGVQRYRLGLADFRAVALPFAASGQA
ncbi:HAD-IIIC family phosphatase [uncultured Phenylobacterium sp.]|uniref:HAD-IIIC family phosphatase n=1 Tax=uncultured Phenylobacterium sp. TaxID=349273 RepID=UPI0025CF3682|nr:HAD-IIIC family phosphatase [uncultured Phenylobacterium sp.]